MAKRSKEYWAQRALEREAEAYARGSELSARLCRAYEKAALELRQRVADFYGRYAAEQGLTLEAAMRAMNRAEDREWKASLGEWVERINAETDKTVKARLKAELDALSYNSRISRLEALHSQSRMTMDELYARCVRELKAELGVTLEEGVYKKTFDLQDRAGFIRPMAKFDAGMIEDAISYPWSGAHFSNRLWQNKDALLFHLREDLTQGLIQGRSLPELSKGLAGRMGQSYKTAERLVHTEVNHFHNEADKTAYRAAGVEWYEFMATLDATTCAECGAMDGKHFRLDEAREGENYPPMHPNDRCTTVEWDPEEKEDWVKSGKPMPKGMTYEEWRREQEALQEGDLSDRVRRGAKSLVGQGNVVGFAGLPEECQEAFRDGLAKAAPEAKELLRREYRKADYIVSDGKRSYYRGLNDVVEIGRDAEPSTLAHELFHRLDQGGSISKTLMPGLTQDYVALNVMSGGNIKSYLVRRYPTAFGRLSYTGEPVMLPEYRGIADILNGLAGGKANYGFGHRAPYWAEPGTLEAEAWAQFGRIQFENSPETLKMLSDLFPNLEKSAMIALKGLI